MTDDAARPESIEAAPPGFVHDHGWTYRECPACFQVIYEGRRIGMDDLGEMVRMHGIACASRGGSSSSR